MYSVIIIYQLLTCVIQSAGVMVLIFFVLTNGIVGEDFTAVYGQISFVQRNSSYSTLPFLKTFNVACNKKQLDSDRVGHCRLQYIKLGSDRVGHPRRW